MRPFSSQAHAGANLHAQTQPVAEQTAAALPVRGAWRLSMPRRACSGSGCYAAHVLDESIEVA